MTETPTGPGFRRVAVGDHLMLGGDNIDLALAHLIERKLGGPRLDGEQWSALRFACRAAKEKLLVEQRPRLERWPVTIAGRGSRVIGGSIQSELTRDEGQHERNEVFRGEGTVFSCSYANECSEVCPKHVDPAAAINQAKFNAVIDWLTGFVTSPRGGK